MDITNAVKIIKLAKPFWKLAAAIITAIAIAYFAGSAIKSLSAGIHDKQTLIAINQRRIDTVSSIKSDLGLVGETNYVKLRDFMPTPDDVASIPGKFSAIASRSSLAVTTVFGALSDTNINTQNAGYKISTIDVNLQLSGDIKSFIKFLKDIERSAYFLKITDISVSSSETGWLGESNISARALLYLKQQTNV